MSGSVVVRCVFCKATREVDGTERGIPMCVRCFSPMVAESARATAYPVTCPACRGTGGGVYNDCPTCDGNGVV